MMLPLKALALKRFSAAIQFEASLDPLEFPRYSIIFLLDIVVAGSFSL